jgi:hypothetical protein
VTLFNKTKGLRRYRQSAIWTILCCLLHLMCADHAWSQARTESQVRADPLIRQVAQLQGRLQRLANRVASLETFQHSIICGRLDSDLLKEGVSIFPLTCQLDRDRPPANVEPPLLKATLMRPGVFAFEFDRPKPQKPLVLATPLKSWGGVPIEMSSLRVADVTQTGFTIETFEAAGPINPSNVSFFFVVLAEPWRE